MASPHVTIAYKDTDDDDDGNQQLDALLPTNNRASSASRGTPWLEFRQPRDFTRCKWIVLYLAIAIIFVAGLELAFHGMEAEAIQAAKNKFNEIEGNLGQQFKGGYSKLLTAIKRPPSMPVHSGKNGTESISTNAEAMETSKSRLDALKNNTVIVLKTGASVMFDRLPVQLLQAQMAIHPEIHSTGRPGYHGPSFFVYSDTEVQLGPFAVHNALANVSAYARNLPDFARPYAKLQQQLSSGHLKAEGFGDGWSLDKWKFLYMWQDAYRRNPTAEWYIGYEADAFVLWDSLFKFLSTQDAGKEQLFGCGSILIANQELFANGGCPYVMSGALMRATYGKDPNFASRFDDSVRKSCCGDAEFSIALRKSASKEIKTLGDAGARFQRERPRDILFDGGNWCQPILSFHHLKPEEVQWLSQIERDIRAKKNENQTVLYSDVFEPIAPAKLSAALQSIAGGAEQNGSVELNPTQEHWEAFSSSDQGGSEGGRTTEADDCKQACIGSDGCTTWLWLKATEDDAGGACYTMRYGVRIGKRYEGSGLRTSGWVGSRIASFKADHHCSSPPEA